MAEGMPSIPHHSHTDCIMQEIHPPPKELIQRWRDYLFIKWYKDRYFWTTNTLLERRPQQALQITDSQILAPSLHIIRTLQAQIDGEVPDILNLRTFLMQSPNLIHMLQARHLLLPSQGWNLATFFLAKLFQVWIVLDLPWGSIQECICSLRPFIIKKSGSCHLFFLWLPMVLHELEDLCPLAIVCRDLACGFLGLIQRIETGNLPMVLW
jgi:hypothetical protein